ncbi:hypothetical protein J1N35_014155 [Gossypium stocksii]|uniref:Uncharacterized protein n=1 Tax=Gossypium stocksii TaxID=47602 RepID=A0A9D4A918_9ROSI|nr:hypothetical protein J1N35_014155 [Gossypium stocksii]
MENLHLERQVWLKKATPNANGGVRINTAMRSGGNSKQSLVEVGTTMRETVDDIECDNGLRNSAGGEAIAVEEFDRAMGGQAETSW